MMTHAPRSLLRPGRTLRVALHPDDLLRPGLRAAALRGIDAALGSGAVALTYETLLRSGPLQLGRVHAEPRRLALGLRGGAGR